MLLTSAHQQLSEGLELDDDQPDVDRYSAVAEDLQAKALSDSDWPCSFRDVLRQRTCIM